MTDARRFIGVRVAAAGIDYANYVADRDQLNFSQAIRYLLSLGARTDKELHDTGQSDGTPGDRAERSVTPRHVRADAQPSRDYHGDGSSRELPDVPDRTAEAAADRNPLGLGDALANLHYAGLAPVICDDEPRSA